jgi:carbamoyl-phosphate synthase large subunit
MINILVTGVGSLLGQGIIKTIKKSNIKSNIFGTDYFETAVGLYWVKKGYLLPDVLKKSNLKNWLTKFIYICRKEKIDIIIPGLDFETPILSKYKTTIEKKTKSKILVSSFNVIKICNDKWETIEFLKKNNFLYPKSCLPNNINKFLINNKFPLIVKPRFESTSKNISIVKNINELKKSLINCKKPIIQEIVGNKKNEYTCGSTLINGKILSTITLKRELKNGNTKIAFHNKNINLDDFLCDVTKKLVPYGPTNFQLMLTKNGPVIFEINPRFSGTTIIRAMFGLNEIDLILSEIYKLKIKKNKLKYGTIIRYFEDFYVNNKDLIK